MTDYTLLNRFMVNPGCRLVLLRLAETDPLACFRETLDVRPRNRISFRGSRDKRFELYDLSWDFSASWPNSFSMTALKFAGGLEGRPYTRLLASFGSFRGDRESCLSPAHCDVHSFTPDPLVF
jgi:hypothetical protein